MHISWSRPFRYLVPLLLLSGVSGLAKEPEFRPVRVVKPFPAIKSPKVVPVDQAGPFVRAEELVLGVVVGKEARAYPINMLTNPTREIINDKLGERSIAATW